MLLTVFLILNGKENMSLFKKLFSRNKPEKGLVSENVNSDDEIREQEISKLEIDFGERKVFPYFMRFENHELQEGHQASVFHFTQDEKPLVLQTIVLQDDEGLGLMDNTEMSEAILDNIDKQAQANIDIYPVDFQFHPEYQQNIIVAQGPVFTSEAILSEEQMLKAHLLLNADEIMVAIPRRGVILAVNNDSSEDIRNAFLGLHVYIWNDEKEDDDLSQICEDVFLLKHGKIEGAFYLNL